MVSTKYVTVDQKMLNFHIKHLFFFFPPLPTLFSRTPSVQSTTPRGMHTTVGNHCSSYCRFILKNPCKYSIQITTIEYNNSVSLEIIYHFINDFDNPCQLELIENSLSKTSLNNILYYYFPCSLRKTTWFLPTPIKI